MIGAHECANTCLCFSSCFCFLTDLIAYCIKKMLIICHNLPASWTKILLVENQVNSYYMRSSEMK